MKRSDLEHLLRAAGRVIDADQIIVVGSQAVLTTIPEFMLPPEATMSVEADLIPPRRQRSSRRPDRRCHRRGIHVPRDLRRLRPRSRLRTITAPDGWRDREYSSENTDGVTGLCLEINDLWFTKLAAGRPKDFDFCRALVRAKLITTDVVRSRTATIDPRIDAAELATRVERLLGEHDSK